MKELIPVLFLDCVGERQLSEIQEFPLVLALQSCISREKGASGPIEGPRGVVR